MTKLGLCAERDWRVAEFLVKAGDQIDDKVLAGGVWVGRRAFQLRVKSCRLVQRKCMENSL
jgi:hypothetical protein